MISGRSINLWLKETETQNEMDSFANAIAVMTFVYINTTTLLQ